MKIQKAQTLEELNELCLKHNNPFLEANVDKTINNILINSLDDGFINCIKISDGSTYRLYSVNYAVNEVNFIVLEKNCIIYDECIDAYVKSNKLWSKRNIEMDRITLDQNGWDKISLKKFIEFIETDRVYTYKFNKRINKRELNRVIITTNKQPILKNGHICLSKDDIYNCKYRFYLSPKWNKIIMFDKNDYSIEYLIRPLYHDYHLTAHNSYTNEKFFFITLYNWILSNSIYLDKIETCKIEYKKSNERIKVLEPIMGYKIKTIDCLYLNGTDMLIRIYPAY